MSLQTSAARPLPRFGLAAKLLFLAGACLTLWLLGAMTHSSQASADPRVAAGTSTSGASTPGTSTAPRAELPHAVLLRTVDATLGHDVVRPVVHDAADKVVRPVAHEVVDRVVRPVVHPVVHAVVDHVVRPVAHEAVDRVVRPVVHTVVDHVVRPVVDDIAPRPADTGAPAAVVTAVAAAASTANAVERNEPATSDSPHAVPRSAPSTTPTQVRTTAPIHFATSPSSAVAHGAARGERVPSTPTGPTAPIGGYTPAPSRAFAPDLPMLGAQAPISGDDDRTHVVTAERTNDLLGTLLRSPGFSPD